MASCRHIMVIVLSTKFMKQHCAWSVTDWVTNNGDDLRQAMNQSGGMIVHNLGRVVILTITK